MFKRRSIRSKLFVALAILSAIVLLLAVSGFWGLYGYQQTTNAILLRYDQQKEARKLQELADRLEKVNDRLIILHKEQPMIGSWEEAVHTKITVAKTEFELDRESFGRTLENYKLVASSSPRHAKLALHARESRLTFERVEDAFTPVSSHLTDTQFVGLSQRWTLMERIQLLNQRTDDLVTFLEKDVKALMNDLHGHYRTWTSAAWLCTAIALGMVGSLLLWLNSLVVKPFRTLLDGSRLVAGGQFDHRIDLGTGDELSELAVAMNEMTDRFQNSMAHIEKMCDELDQEVKVRSQEVIRNEQLAGVGFLAAGFAHEINNPMAAIAWSAEAIESRMNDLMMLPDDERLLDSEMTENWRENLQRIEGEAFRCKSIIEKMLLFSRMGQVEKTSFDIVPLVNDVIEMVGTLGKYKCQSLRLFGDETAIVYANDQEIRQVILNLVTNALESVDCDGDVSIYINQGPKTSTVRVKDTGCGMSAEVQAHLFEPFFTRRRDGTGTGLGLSISHRIVCQHGGQLSARSEGENRGSEFELRLPIAAITEEVTSPAYESWKFQDAQQTQAA